MVSRDKVTDSRSQIQRVSSATARTLAFTEQDGSCEKVLSKGVI